MGKLKNAAIRVSIDPDNDKVKVSVVPDEVKSRIPRPGDSMYLVAPYPVVDPEDVDGEEIVEEDIKLKPIMGYSYTATMVKSSVLTDEMDEVIVNGDYRIPLYKTSGETNKKLMVFTNEEEAISKFKTLMNVSIAETKRRLELYNHIQDNLQESLKEMFH